MKNLGIFSWLFLVALCAFAVPAHAACSTAPSMTGVIGLHPASPPTPPAAEWITLFYRNPTKPYTMLTWYGHGPDYADQITNGNIKFGVSSGVVINTGTQCVYSACADFTGDRITTLYLPGLQADNHIDVIADGIKVAEWDGVWNRNSSSPLGAAPVSWSDGITEIESPTQFGHPISMLYFGGWHTDATHTFPKVVRVDLANSCGAITG
jgi:hypothetical protein